MIKRVIPLLLYKDGRLVKGVKYKNFRDVGESISAIKIYNNQLADELILINISENINEIDLFLKDVVKNCAKNCFVPLTVGGKISKLEQIEKLLKSGSDKVLITSQAVKDINFLKLASKNFGNQCLVVGVEYKFIKDGYYVTYQNSKRNSKIKVDDYLKKIQDNGAGEIALFDVDKDGTMNGPSIKNLKNWSDKVNLPIIYAGGIGNFKHILDLFEQTKINAVACGSLFNFGDNTPIRIRSYLKNNSFPVRNAR